MRKLFKRFCFFGLIVFVSLLITYSDSQSQTSQMSPPCPACYKDEGGTCVPDDSNSKIKDNTNQRASILGNGDFADFLSGLGKLFGGGSNSKFDAKIPECQQKDAPSWDNTGWKFPVDVTSKGNIPKQLYPSGREIVPMTSNWNPKTSGGRVDLLEQFDPNELMGNTVGGAQGDLAQNNKAQWRGNCGRGIFLYEQLKMKNSNVKSFKGPDEPNGKCDPKQFSKGNVQDFDSELCRVSADDLADGVTWSRNADDTLEDKTLGKKLVPQIYTGDIWYSRTGCYNPEERFVNVPSFPTPGYFFGLGQGYKSYMYDYFDPIFSNIQAALLGPLSSALGGMGVKYPGPLDEPMHYRYSDITNESKLWRPRKGSEEYTEPSTGKKVTVETSQYSSFLVPNDRLLIRNPMCLKVGASTPGLDPLERDYAIKNLGVIRSSGTQEFVKQGKYPICLQVNETLVDDNLYDVLDDADNFCGEFLKSANKNTANRYYLSGNCWESKSVILAPGPHDHWMPAAVKSQPRTRKDFVDPDSTAEPELKLKFTDGTLAGRYGDTNAKSGKMRYDRLAGFWRVTGDSNKQADLYEKENVRYVVREYINNLNYPTYSPHSLKNAFNNQFNPEFNPLVNPNLPQTYETDMTNKLASNCVGSSGTKGSGSDYEVSSVACFLGANRMVQGEYGYRNYVIERGPFNFFWMDTQSLASPANNPKNFMMPNPYRDGLSFSFDEAAQMLRGNKNNPNPGTLNPNTKIDPSLSLKYLPGKIIPVDYPFNPYNIYSPTGPAYNADQLNIPQNYGRKFKTQQCLRLFIEKWAFEGDKGNIVINKNLFKYTRSGAANFKPDISYCQWSAYYAASDGLPEDAPEKGEYQRRYTKFNITEKVGKFVFDNISSAISGSGQGDIKYTTKTLDGFNIRRPLNSEFFDYLNFATMGSVEMADESGCNTLNCFIASNVDLGSLYENAGIDVGEIANNPDLSKNAIEKWQAGEIDLAKRDCTTVVPPNYQRDNIRPFEKCNGFKYGWWRIRNPIKNLFCLGDCTTNAEVSALESEYLENAGSSTDALTGGRDSGGGVKKLGQKFSSLLGGMMNSTDNLSFLTTEVDTPIFSLVTPIIQGLPTIGMGMKFPTDNNSNEDQKKDSGSEEPESGSFPSFDAGGKGDKGDGMPDTGTVDLKVLYFQWSMPPIKLYLRDNWLSRMGGIRVVPYNLISAAGGSIGVEGPEENFEEKWDRSEWSSWIGGIFGNKTGVCCDQSEMASLKLDCQVDKGKTRIVDVRKALGKWTYKPFSSDIMGTGGCTFGANGCGDGTSVCSITSSPGSKPVAKKQNFAGLPIIQFKEGSKKESDGSSKKLNLPAGVDWYDHTLSARSCQHTILSALLGDFAGQVSPDLKEAWSNNDDISLLATLNALKAIPGIISSFQSAISSKNFQPVIEGTRIYGGFKVFRLQPGAEEDGDGTEEGGNNTKDVNEPADPNEPGSTATTHKKYTGGEKYRKFYSWFPSPWSFKHGSARNYWCEFQLPYNPYYHGEKEWEYGKTPIFGHGNLNSYFESHKTPFIYQQGPGTTGALISGQRPQLTYYRPERIRDGCGAFAVRATWIDDKEDDLSAFLIGNDKDNHVIHKNRCSKWQGLFGAKYDDPKMVSWRLPRFDYEFLKSFIECTGPIREAPQNCKINDYAKRRNVEEGAKRATALVGTTVACIYGGGQKSCKGIPNELLRMLDYFTRGDTWYGKAFLADYNFASTDAMDSYNSAQKLLSMDEINTLDNLMSGTNKKDAGKDAMNDIKDAMNNEFELNLQVGTKINKDGTLPDGSTIGSTTDADGNITGGGVNVEEICKNRYGDAKDNSGMDISAAAIDTCKKAGENYKKDLAKQIGTAANNGSITTTPGSDDPEDVGDLSCYERNIKNVNYECFHGGKKDLIAGNKEFDGVDDPSRNRPCQDCSMQISSFWRVKATEDIIEKKSLFGLGLFEQTLTRLKVKETYGTNEPFGFWCTCNQDNPVTTRCREDLCTCDQHVLFIGRSLGGISGNKQAKESIEKQVKENNKKMGKLNQGDATQRLEYQKLQKQNDSLARMLNGSDSDTATSGWSSPWAICKDYGPMRRWLQCYYQARAKACPVLTREISDTEPPANLMNNMRFTDGIAFYKKTSDPVDTNYLDSGKTGFAPVETTGLRDAGMPMKSGLLSCGKRNATGLNILSNKFARWMAEEPNHLARLPVRFESAGASFKHQDFVFQAQTRDIEAPFMEMSVPFPIDLLSRGPAAQDSIERSILNERGTDAEDPNSAKKEVYLVKSPRGNELGEIVSRGASYSIDIGQLLVPKNQEGKLNQKYWDLAVKFEAGIHAAHIGYMDGSKPETYDNGAGILGNDHKRVPLRAQDAVVGPRGCDIGGWYEMMLYQARCIKFFGLNCICDYDKTFARGDDKSYVLGKAGMEMLAVYPVMKDVTLKWKNVSNIPDQIGRDTGKSTSDKRKARTTETAIEKSLNKELKMPVYAQVKDQAANDQAASTAQSYGVEYVTKFFPLMDRGIVGPEFALGSQGDTNRPDHRLWQKDTYKGLDQAMVGDIMMYDESITYSDGTYNNVDAGYPRHVAYVSKVNRQGKNDSKPGQPTSIEVYEMNWGKNLDSCGVTDAWSLRTSRVLMRPEELDKKLNERVQKYASCQNADWKVCEEKYWEQVRLYRPYKIQDSGGKLSAVADPAYPICSSVKKPEPLGWLEVKKRLGLSSGMEAQDFIYARKTYSVKEVIDDYNNNSSSAQWLNGLNGNKWLYAPDLEFNSYDLRDIEKYVNDIGSTIGVCDPDPELRDNIRAVKDDYIQGKDYLDVINK